MNLAQTNSSPDATIESTNQNAMEIDLDGAAIEITTPTTQQTLSLNINIKAHMFIISTG